MKVIITHKYSELDQQHQFGIVFEDGDHCIFYIRWVWYYLGAFIGLKKPRIYPYSVSEKIYKEYRFCNDAQRQAKLIVNAINKKLSNQKQ